VIKIADTRLGYKNRALIELLQERGKLLADDADKAEVLEKDV
jgi:hypothetical protein